MKQVGQSIELFDKGEGVVDLDIDDSDQYVIAMSSQGSACLYDRENKKIVKKIGQSFEGADIVRFIP